MAILSKEEAKQILEKVMSFSAADSLEAGLSGSGRGNIRYARNTVTTSGFNDDISLGVTANFGKKSAMEASAKKGIMPVKNICRSQNWTRIRNFHCM